MQIQESGEMYLETILILQKKRGYVRSIDVSEYMGYSKPSVSRAVKVLGEGGYLFVSGGGQLCLTDRGREIAEKIYERHKLLSEYLMRLGVDEKTAVEDACKIEHVISDASFAAMKRHVSLFENSESAAK